MEREDKKYKRVVEDISEYILYSGIVAINLLSFAIASYIVFSTQNKFSVMLWITLALDVYITIIIYNTYCVEIDKRRKGIKDIAKRRS